MRSIGKRTQGDISTPRFLELFPFEGICLKSFLCDSFRLCICVSQVTYSTRTLPMLLLPQIYTDWTSDLLIMLNLSQRCWRRRCWRYWLCSSAVQRSIHTCSTCPPRLVSCHVGTDPSSSVCFKIGIREQPSWCVGVCAFLIQAIVNPALTCFHSWWGTPYQSTLCWLSEQETKVGVLAWL